MKLTWAQNNDNDFSNYTIYQSTTPGIPGQPIKIIIGRTTTTFTVSNLSPNVTYYFTVRIFDTEELYMDSNQVNGTTLIVTPRPTAVTLNLPSQVTATSAELTWTQSMDTDFTNYTIYQSTMNGMLGTPIYAITDRNTASYTVPNLQSNTTYYFTIRVYNIDGLYNNSAQISATTLSEGMEEEKPAEALPPLLYIYIIPIIIVVVVVGAIALRKKKVGKADKASPEEEPPKEEPGIEEEESITKDEE